MSSDELLGIMLGVGADKKIGNDSSKEKKERVANSNISISSTYDKWLKYFEIVSLEKLLVLRESNDYEENSFIVQSYFPLLDEYDSVALFKKKNEAEYFFEKEIERFKAMNQFRN